MAFYSRMRMILESSDTDDYAKPKVDQTEQTATASTQRRYEDVFAVGTSATTYRMAHLATCTLLKLHNPSTNTYKVTATLKTNANSGTGFLIDINPGQTVLMTDLYATGGAVADLSITSTTAAQKIKVAYEGT